MNYSKSLKINFCEGNIFELMQILCVLKFDLRFSENSCIRFGEFVQKLIVEFSIKGS